MTGIVVVSHSRALADAAVALASEMVHGTQARIQVAAGLDPTTFGTDAAAIVDAIVAADDGAGVVVLMDLGSAVLSAEMALDLVDADLRQRVVLCPAPLVEGLVVAAVAAAGGAGPAEVAAEAVGSLAAKQSHVHESTPPDLARPAVPAGDEAGRPDGKPLTAVFEVSNAHGLHARPAARLVQEARLFDARIQLRNLTTGAGPVPATSLSKVATLGVLRGHQVEVGASGSQAREALDHVLALATRGFDERASGVDAGTGCPCLRHPESRWGRHCSCALPTWRYPPRTRPTPRRSGDGCARRWPSCDVRSNGCARRRPGRSVSPRPGSSTLT